MKTVDELYYGEILPLPPRDRLRLLALIAEELAREEGADPEHSLLELEGLGAEIWKGIDAQEYVNQLRDEWDGRP